MKNFIKVFMLSVLALTLMVETSYCLTIKYNDNYANWPGWFIDPRDYIGYPRIQDIQGVNVTIDDVSRGLQSVVITMETPQRQIWDTLFINTGGAGSYQAWDYYVRTDFGGPTLYSVNDPNNYTYILAPGPAPGRREGHPAGIVSSDLTQDALGILNSVIWDDSGPYTLSYSFDPGIVLGSNFVIGYSQWCANDVFLTPEPTAILLLGMGLIGVGVLARKLRKQRTIKI